MAGSRLTHHGTIFSRLTGLLETGALKEAPLWYNIYKKYPPELEPYSERPVPPQEPILEIVYEEDFDRVRKSNPRKMSKSSNEKGKTDTKQADVTNVTG